MPLLIFKTNIGTKRQLNALRPLLNNQMTIKRWTVDMEDIDKVLRIEAIEPLEERHIINLIRAKGLYCEVLG